MNLVLMRHGIAELRSRHHESDTDRNLTDEGRKQLLAFFPYLYPLFPKPNEIFVSPAVRTWQTAALLCDSFKIPESQISKNALLQDGSVGEIVSWLKALKVLQSLWIIGHQPTLGQLLCSFIGLDVFKGFQMKQGDCALITFFETFDVNKGRLICYASPLLNEIRNMTMR
ncbi:MAG: histidine phosphatase family protein [Candidatus Marinimicrobia bacterium]|nr:histidine phosphatase family protein [Candidatus Neomarinimicrobiota bacterium]MDD5582091.1 histidine phosphatase family protein [Candidatus Neomarinimicrobiota bacterium]